MDLFQSSHERRQRQVGEVEAFIATNQERVVDMVEKEVRRLVYYLLIGPSTIGIQNRKSSRFD